MRRLLRTIPTSLLHAFCVLALTMSCGLPDALHDLGHLLAHTECGATTEHAPNTMAARNGLETCALQTLAASITQFSALGSSTPRIVSTPFPSAVGLAKPSTPFVSHDHSYWHTSRGPPAV